jgi:Domain found in Dishevelled, Egl-10, and Pleckstrin (DEP)
MKMKSEIATLYDAFLKHVEVRDRRRLTGLLVKNCFVGSEAVDAMIVGANVTNKREEAIYLIRRLQKELRMFRPVGGNHRFQDSKRHFYRLTVHDSIRDTTSLQAITKTSNEDLDLNEKAKLFFQLANIGDHKQGLKRYSFCFVGCEIVDRLVYCGLVTSRLDGVRLGRKLAQEMELFNHVSHKHYFTDDSSLYCFAPGVLRVIYELQTAEKEHGFRFPTKQVNAVIASLHSKLPSSSESKLSAIERLIHGRAKKYGSSFVRDAVEVTSDDDESVLSAPEMSQSVLSFLDDDKESMVSQSNSFDTLNDIIKQGGLQSDSISLYSTFEDSCGFPRDFGNGSSIRLGNAANIGGDGSRIQFTVPKRKPFPYPCVFHGKGLLCEDGSIESEPEYSMDRTPCNVDDVKTMTPESTIRKGMTKTMFPLPKAQPTLYPSGIKFSSIVVEKCDEDDDDMTQITMDKCFATVVSTEQSGGIVPTAFVDEEGSSPLRMGYTSSLPKIKPLSPEVSMKSASSSERQQRSKYSNQSSTMSFQSMATPKKRISKILRRDLWSCDETVIGIALEELCDSLEDDLTVNGAHVVYCGGVMALKRTLEEHLQIESIQYHGCVALGKLASLDLETQAAIAEMDGIPLVVQSMQHHVDSRRIQEAGRSALASICWRSDI